MSVDPIDVPFTGNGTSQHYLELAGRQLDALATFLGSLGDSEIDNPSLCPGWRVRDVAAHICSTTELSVSAVVGRVVRSGMRPSVALHRWAIEHGDRTTRSELANHFRAAAVEYQKGRRPGGSRLAQPREIIVDCVVHGADMALPLGHSYEPDPAILLAALEAMPHVGDLMKCKQRARGLNLSATDVDWQLKRSDLPAVRGPAVSLLLAITGRPEGLAGLDGAGVALLASRANPAV